jgi:DNA invertase Pin-like site-specific DNA recombinase
MQLSAMRSLAERMNADVVGVFEIPGESAFTDEIVRRPEFDAALCAAERGEFDMLIMYDFSRFARDQYLAHASLRRLRKAGVELFDPGGREYTKDPLLSGLHAMVAEMQSADASRKIRDAYRRRFEMGLPTGDLPFGYGRSATNEPPPIVEEEADAVRWAFNAYATGIGFVGIAEEFNRRGLRPHSKRGYAGFVASSIQRIIENRFYCGFVTHLGQERIGRHEPIVSVAAWEAAQGRRQHIRRTPHETTLLTGIAVCAACSGPIWTSGWDRRRVNRYYREPSHQQLRECVNARTLWQSSEADERIDALVRAFGAEKDWPAFVEREARKVAAPKVSGRSREKIQEDRRRVGELFRAGVYGEAEWRRVDGELARELADVPVVVSEVLAASTELQGWASVWEVATMAERREAVRMMLERVELDTRAKAVTQVVPREKYKNLFWMWALFAGTTPDRTGALLQQTGWTLKELGL